MRRGAVTTLTSSMLVRGGGVAIVPLPGGWLGPLRTEVAALLDRAVPAQRDHPGPAGPSDPPRSMHHIAGGPALDQMYAAAALRAILTIVTGVHWRPQGRHASYSLYGAGGHLGPHRDLPGCDLTLEYWPTRGVGPIGMIEAEPSRGRREVRARPGEALVILGRVVPHRLPPLPAGAQRVVAPLCFTLLGDTSGRPT
jgi:hypothetical protein